MLEAGTRALRRHRVSQELMSFGEVSVTDLVRKRDRQPPQSSRSVAMSTNGTAPRAAHAGLGRCSSYERLVEHCVHEMIQDNPSPLCSDGQAERGGPGATRRWAHSPRCPPIYACDRQEAACLFAIPRMSEDWRWWAECHRTIHPVAPAGPSDTEPRSSAETGGPLSPHAAVPLCPPVASAVHSSLRVASCKRHPLSLRTHRRVWLIVKVSLLRWVDTVKGA